MIIGLLVSVKTKEQLFIKCKGKSKDYHNTLRYLGYKMMFDKVERKAKVLYGHGELDQCKNDMRKNMYLQTKKNT